MDRWAVRPAFCRRPAGSPPVNRGAAAWTAARESAKRRGPPSSRRRVFQHRHLSRILQCVLDRLANGEGKNRVWADLDEEPPASASSSRRTCSKRTGRRSCCTSSPRRAPRRRAPLRSRSSERGSRPRGARSPRSLRAAPRAAARPGGMRSDRRRNLPRPQAFLLALPAGARRVPRRRRRGSSTTARFPRQLDLLPPALDPRPELTRRQGNRNHRALAGEPWR